MDFLNKIVSDTFKPRAERNCCFNVVNYLNKDEKVIDFIFLNTNEVKNPSDEKILFDFENLFITVNKLVFENNNTEVELFKILEDLKEPLLKGYRIHEANKGTCLSVITYSQGIDKQKIKNITIGVAFVNENKVPIEGTEPLFSVNLY